MYVDTEIKSFIKYSEKIQLFNIIDIRNTNRCFNISDKHPVVRDTLNFL